MATNASEAASRIVESPFCDNLRSKKYYMLDGMPTEEAHILDASGYCWCFTTQGAVGPDGHRVGPSLCGPGRPCYRSTFAVEP
jgi:hypothetical protein